MKNDKIRGRVKKDEIFVKKEKSMVTPDAYDRIG